MRTEKAVKHTYYSYLQSYLQSQYRHHDFIRYILLVSVKHVYQEQLVSL